MELSLWSECIVPALLQWSHNDFVLSYQHLNIFVLSYQHLNITPSQAKLPYVHSIINEFIQETALISIMDLDDVAMAIQQVSPAVYSQCCTSGLSHSEWVWGFFRCHYSLSLFSIMAGTGLWNMLVYDPHLFVHSCVLIYLRCCNVFMITPCLAKIYYCMHRKNDCLIDTSLGNTGVCNIINGQGINLT